LRVVVAGGDGFIGWPLSIALSHSGHEVLILDNFIRRSLVGQVGSESLIPIVDLPSRIHAWHSMFPQSASIEHVLLDVASDEFGLNETVARFSPDAFFHLATMPSAPYSMKNRHTRSFTVANNIRATFNVLSAVADHAKKAHVIHIGTMGVYGYDVEDYSLPEGYLSARISTARGEREISILHPMKPGSLYHLTKAQDQLFFEYFNRLHGVRITDLHQGIVWGVNTDLTCLNENLATRLDYDSDFGTVLNRFAAQAAIGYPMTVYGSGKQKRAFIHLRDSIQCLLLAMNNPPAEGEGVRIFNQFTQIFSVGELANLVANVSHGQLGPIENPRVEKEANTLSAINARLHELGLRPTLLQHDLVQEILAIAKQNKSRIDPAVIKPMSFWPRK
jgi:UDP-sulfoquinovose synthase